MTRLGAYLFSLCGEGNVISGYAAYSIADILYCCYNGPNINIYKGCLINAGAQIHHEVKIGEFSVANPGAVVLSGVRIGSFSSIGANATIRLQVKIGDNVIIGAGSVVMKAVPDGVTVVGVPGRIISRKYLISIHHFSLAFITKSSICN